MHEIVVPKEKSDIDYLAGYIERYLPKQPLPKVDGLDIGISRSAAYSRPVNFFEIFTSENNTNFMIGNCCDAKPGSPFLPLLHLYALKAISLRHISMGGIFESVRNIMSSGSVTADLNISLVGISIRTMDNLISYISAGKGAVYLISKNGAQLVSIETNYLNKTKKLVKKIKHLEEGDFLIILCPELAEAVNAETVFEMTKANLNKKAKKVAEAIIDNYEYSFPDRDLMAIAVKICKKE